MIFNSWPEQIYTFYLHSTIKLDVWLLYIFCEFTIEKGKPYILS